MDQTKSETEEITFPFVCFSVDDHEEAWSDIIVRLEDLDFNHNTRKLSEVLKI